MGLELNVKLKTVKLLQKSGLCDFQFANEFLDATTKGIELYKSNFIKIKTSNF